MGKVCRKMAIFHAPFQIALRPRRPISSQITTVDIGYIDNKLYMEPRSASDEIRNMVHGAVEHGSFGDVLFCVILRPDGEARQITSPIFGPLEESTMTPLRPPTSPMKTNPTIRIARNDPNGPILARSGDDLTI